MYATKCYKYDLLNVYHIQNADSITAFRINQNSRFGVISDDRPFRPISNGIAIYKEYIKCA